MVFKSGLEESSHDQNASYIIRGEYGKIGIFRRLP